jgi:hypothetical protein
VQEYSIQDQIVGVVPSQRPTKDTALAHPAPDLAYYLISLFPQGSAKKCAAPQASMSINPTCTLAVKRSSCVRQNNCLTKIDTRGV